MGMLNVAVVVLVTFEVGYFAKIFVYGFAARFFRSRIHPLQFSTSYGLCTTRDIDILLTHLNNSRCLRAMDFARLDHFLRCRLSSAIRQHGGTVAVASTVIRYRKPVYLFLPFAVDTGIVHWDDRCIYYRQDVRTLHDNFIRATAYLKIAILGCTPLQVLKGAMRGYTPPLKDVCNTLPVPATSVGLSEDEQSIGNGEDFNATSSREIFNHNITNSHSNVESYESSNDAGGDNVASIAVEYITGDQLARYIANKPMSVDLASFMKYNELSSLRLKACRLVNCVTLEAVNRLDKH